eukprot:COSAG05_NODE_702_length_7857_cov_37.135244_2_plen_278_part_00
MPQFLRVLVEQIMRTMASGALQRGATTRPALPSILAALPKVTVSGDMCEQDCSVCQDMFREGERVARMPCGHAYHSACLQPWLRTHNTCPTCRYELDTTDEQYNQHLRATRANEVDVREARLLREGTGSQLAGWSTVELKQVLRGRGVDYSTALEKLDLVRLVQTSTPALPRAAAQEPAGAAAAAAAAAGGATARARDEDEAAHASASASVATTSSASSAATAGSEQQQQQEGRRSSQGGAMGLLRSLRRLRRRQEVGPLGSGESSATRQRRERRSS